MVNCKQCETQEKVKGRKKLLDSFNEWEKSVFLKREAKQITDWGEIFLTLYGPDWTIEQSLAFKEANNL